MTISEFIEKLAPLSQSKLNEVHTVIAEQARVLGFTGVIFPTLESLAFAYDFLKRVLESDSGEPLQLLDEQIDYAIIEL